MADKALGTHGTFRRLHARITKEAHPPRFAPFVHFEAMASRIHSWDNRFITGLVQTEDYARAIIRATKAGIPADVIDRDVAARTEHQQVLDREEPPFCWFVIAESALRASFGGPTVGEVVGDPRGCRRFERPGDLRRRGDEELLRRPDAQAALPGLLTPPATSTYPSRLAQVPHKNSQSRWEL
jgi:hypothetical protein